MALHLPPKAPSDIREYRWTPKEGDCPSGSAVTVSTGTATIADELDGEAVLITVTGGATGVTQVLAASATVGDETITETIYIPILATNQQVVYTGQDFATFALRKIVGNGETPDAAETLDALERLTDWLAAMSGQGADLGVPLPVTTATQFYISDSFAQAVKFNLRLLCHEHYGEALSGFDAEMARRGVQLVKSALLPNERRAAEYY